MEGSSLPRADPRLAPRPQVSQRIHPVAAVAPSSLRALFAFARCVRVSTRPSLVSLSRGLLIVLPNMDLTWPCPALSCSPSALPCPALPWPCLGPPSAAARPPRLHPRSPPCRRRRLRSLDGRTPARLSWTPSSPSPSPSLPSALHLLSPSPTHPFAVVGTPSGPYSPPSDVADTNRHSTSTSTPVRGSISKSPPTDCINASPRTLSFDTTRLPESIHIDLAIHPRPLRTGPAPPPFLELGR